MKLLLDYLNSIYAMSPALIEHLGNVLKYTEVSKKDYLLKAGRICENVWFIEKGLARCFYTKDDEDISSWFMKEGDVIFSVKSFYKQEPSYESIQMLEDSSLFYITYKELQYIYNNFLEFNYIRGVLTEKYYMLSDERTFSMRMQKAHERYIYLTHHHEDLTQRVPAKYLASYLGISEETLSRIRAGKKY